MPRGGTGVDGERLHVHDGPGRVPIAVDLDQIDYLESPPCHVVSFVHHSLDQETFAQEDRPPRPPGNSVIEGVGNYLIAGALSVGNSVIVSTYMDCYPLNQ
jgi:hypothetical protein